MQRIETTYNVNTIFERLTSTSSTLQPINKQLIILSDIERLLISIPVSYTHLIEMEDEKLCAGAERFALANSGRTPRLARQYIDHIEARIKLNLEI